MRFFRSEAWFSLYRQYLEPAASVQTIDVSQGQTPLVLRPSVLAAPRTRGWVKASGLAALGNYYSMAFGPATAQGLDARAWVDALQPMIAARQPVQLEPLDASVAHALAHEAQRQGLALWLEPTWVHWTEPVPAQGFEAYWQARPSALRNTWKRKHAKALRDHGLKIQIARTPSEVERAWSAYETVYAASWKPHESHPAFVKALALQGASEDVTRLGVLSLDRQAAAAQLWFVQDDTALIYKLAYHEAFKNASPGLLLSHRLMEYTISNEAVQHLDYGSGDDPYKADWMTQRNHKWRLILAHPTSGFGQVMKLASILGRKRQAPLYSADAIRS